LSEQRRGVERAPVLVEAEVRVGVEHRGARAQQLVGLLFERGPQPLDRLLTHRIRSLVAAGLGSTAAAGTSGVPANRRFGGSAVRRFGGSAARRLGGSAARRLGGPRYCEP